MRLTSLIVACVFCLCLLSGCGGENVKTDVNDVKANKTYEPAGTGTQNKAKYKQAPTRD
jgi:hypothetical protein